MKKLIIATVASVFVLTGCNTIKGFGRDVSKTGDAVTTTAQKTEKKCNFDQLGFNYFSHLIMA